MIEPIMDELLLPLVRRVFEFFNTASPSGTDEALVLLDLRKAYLNFIVSLFNSGLEKVLISERNLEHLNMILQAVLHFAKDTSDPTTQKMAFGVALKMVNAWTSTHQLPGFEQFVYNELIPATFTVPMSSGFNLTDGQSLLVSGSMIYSTFLFLLTPSFRCLEKFQVSKKHFIINKEMNSLNT